MSSGHSANKNIPVYNFIKTKLAFMLGIDILGQLIEFDAARLDIQRLFLRVAKYLGEVVRYQSTEDEVGVGNSEWATLAVACWARLSTSALGTSAEEAIAECQARAAACSDGVDVKLGRLDGDTSCRRFVYNLVSSIETGHIGGGAADVQSIKL